MRWEDLREEEFEDAISRSNGLCVLPLGCLEKHGQHLPVGTDYYIAESIAQKAAGVEDAVVFPTGFWLGDVAGFHAEEPSAKKYYGGFGINLKTMLRTLEELCDEIARNSFTKILLFNIHGGSFSVCKDFVNEIARKGKPYTVFYALTILGEPVQPAPFIKTVNENREAFPMLTETDMAVMQSWVPTGYQGGHANFLETALLMGDYPHLVAPDRYYAENGLNNHRTDYLTSRGISIRGDWDSRYPNSYSGAAPHGCSQSIGEAMLQIHTEYAARVYRTIKNSDVSEAANL